MRENDLPPVDEFDHRMRGELATASRWAADNARPAGAARAIRRSRTRRATRYGAGALAASAAVTALVVTRPDTVQVVPTPPAASSGVTSSPLPSATSPTSTPPISTPSTEATPSRVIDPTGAADIDLVADLDGPDWTFERPTAWTEELCPGRPLPGLDRAVDRAIVSASMPEFVDQRALLVFPDAQAAVAFVDGIGRAARSCAVAPLEASIGTQHVLQQPVQGPWGSAVAVMQVIEPPAGQTPIRSSSMMAGRRGSAVVLRFVRGETFHASVPRSIDPAVLADLQRPLEPLAPQLCRWTAAGC